MENKRCLTSRLRNVLLFERMYEFKRGNIAHVLMGENRPMTHRVRI